MQGQNDCLGMGLDLLQEGGELGESRANAAEA